MSDKPILSVVIPFYNEEHYLSQTIDSVISQPCKSVELLLINDGSRDDSANICKEYCSKDPRIHYYYKENSGVSASRNMGIQLAKGEYIAFLDGDDRWSKDVFVDEIWDKVISEKPDIVCFNYKQMDKDCKNEIGRIDCEDLEGKIRDSAVDGVYVHFCSLFYKREYLIERELNFDQSLRYYEDLLFKTKAVYLSDSFVRFSAYLLEYRNNPHSVMHRSNEVAFRTQLYECYQKLECFFTEQYLREGQSEKSGYMNARVSILWLNCVENYCLILNTYSEFYSQFIESGKAQVIKKELEQGIIHIPEQSVRILERINNSPKRYYQTERIRQILLNVRRNMYRLLKKNKLGRKLIKLIP